MSVAEAFLAALADPARGSVDAERAALVVAHPDDESLGCGAQLARLRGLHVVHVTDGAPRTGDGAARHGFASPADYALARRAELAAALDRAGVPTERRVALDYPDQGAAARIADLARRLAGLFADREIRVVLTHAYEGGHPDHDAVALAVAFGARLLGGDRPSAIAMPFYHLGPNGPVAGTFAPEPDPPPELALSLSRSERAAKDALLDCHRTQAATLASLRTDTERFRFARAADGAELPNGGRLLYESWRLGIDGPGFLRAAAAAREALFRKGAERRG